MIQMFTYFDLHIFANPTTHVFKTNRTLFLGQTLGPLFALQTAVDTLINLFLFEVD